MANRNSQKEASLSPGGIGDNFAVIAGIGPAINQRIHAAGIHTFKQLAGLSAADLAAFLIEVPGMSAERIDAQRWIEQARDLVLETDPAPERAGLSTDEESELEGRLHYETFTIRVTLDDDQNVRSTHAEHIRQGGVKDIWPGWDSNRLVDFFVQNAELYTRPAQPVPALTGMTDSEANLKIDVTSSLTHLISGVIQMDGQQIQKRLGIQIEFMLSGKNADSAMAEQSRYFAHLLACELRTGMVFMAAFDQGKLNTDRLTNVVNFEFPLPGSPGRYQLIANVLLPEINSIGATLGPILNVIP